MNKAIYLEWRDGRPRWNASPGLKKRGWRGVDLRYPTTGDFMSREDAEARTRQINEAVAVWRGGGQVPAEFADFAPESAGGRPRLVRTIPTHHMTAARRRLLIDHLDLLQAGVALELGSEIPADILDHFAALRDDLAKLPTR